MDIGRELQALRRRIDDVERSARLSRASLDNTSIVVKDADGTVKGHIGMQADGTVGLVTQDGPAPGAPTAPIVTSTIGGLAVTWDGALADGSPLPADFDHVAVHISISSGFTPSAATFVGTITRSGDGGMLPVIPLPYEQHYVVLLAVNTSGIASDPSAETSATPLQVDGPDLSAGSVTAATIAVGAVTAEKLEAILELATRLVAGDPDGARVELNEDGLRVYDASGTLVIRFDSADGSAAFTGSITGSTVSGSTVTGGLIQTATSGERITFNEANQNKIIVYNSSGTAINELSSRGLLVKGTSGAVVSLNPNTTYPQLKLGNSGGTNQALAQVVETVTGDANMELVSGTFTGNGYTDMVWRAFLARDFFAIDRLRASDPNNTQIGGRISLHETSATIGLNNTSDTTQVTSVTVETNLAYVSNGRFQVLPPASTNSMIYGNAATGHTGNLLRLAVNAVDAFKVDASGNTTATGDVIVTGRVKPSTTESANLTLQNSWTNYAASTYGTAQVRKTADGMAYLVGRVNAGTATSGTRIATIPSGFWPLIRHAFPWRTPQATGNCSLLVNELGEVLIYDISGTISNVSFSGMIWPLF